MKQRGLRKTRTGVVVSDKMDKSILVEVRRRVAHPLYKKYMTQKKRFMVHDEREECSVGDVVRIVETRPMSKRKCWRVQARLEKTQ